MRFGAELLVRKQTGKLTGWIGYTISRSQRKVPGDGTPLRSINDGDWYLSNYDKLHDLSVVANYQLDARWDLGGSLCISEAAGPTTPPKGKFVVEGVPVPIYSTRK
ncbi:MAG: hypothetical protein U5L96_15310 [Owenweeksia sp.]|nr:hypothetical protein [Owenweeksia sp.]